MDRIEHTIERVGCGSCGLYSSAKDPKHHADCPIYLATEKAPTHRMRRGKLVEIPEEWRGKFTYPQQRRRRRNERKAETNNGNTKKWSK